MKTRTSGQGRPRGALNRNNQQLRDLILAALDNQPGGGVAYLSRQAIDNPGAFLTLLGKILPKDVNAQVSGADGKPLSMVLQVVGVGSTK